MLTAVEAYRKFADASDVPLHLGITEAGTLVTGAVKSSIGFALLLADGIGDTIRVSLTAEPEEEIPVAYEILRSLELRSRGVTFVSCPSCGRVEIDVLKIANEVEKRLAKVQTPIQVAVMGCVVNGPGESRDADVGLSGGRGKGVDLSQGPVTCARCPKINSWPRCSRKWRASCPNTRRSWSIPAMRRSARSAVAAPARPASTTRPSRPRLPRPGRLASRCRCLARSYAATNQMTPAPDTRMLRGRDRAAPLRQSPQQSHR